MIVREVRIGGTRVGNPFRDEGVSYPSVPCQCEGTEEVTDSVVCVRSPGGRNHRRQNGMIDVFLRVQG